MTAPPPWTGWNKSRSAALRLPQPQQPAIGQGMQQAVRRTPHQYHRHPGTRGLHDRGGAQFAGVGRRRGGSLCGTSGVEPQTETVWRPGDTSMRSAAHRCYKQDGPCKGPTSATCSRAACGNALMGAMQVVPIQMAIGFRRALRSA